MATIMEQLKEVAKAERIAKIKEEIVGVNAEIERWEKHRAEYERELIELMTPLRVGDLLEREKGYQAGRWVITALILEPTAWDNQYCVRVHARGVKKDGSLGLKYGRLLEVSQFAVVGRMELPSDDSTGIDESGEVE